MKIEALYTIFQQYPKVVTDSRRIEKDCLFFALKGERFDGNNFALDALKQGAAFAIIDNADFQLDERCILCEDVLTTLQQLATYHRMTFSIPVVGITGSNGKTTTKELISAVMTSHYKAHSTKGNFNNHIGVPLTLLAMPKDLDIAIIEMGANHVGEIRELCKIARPTHGLITNVGKAHLEGFGGLAGVRKGKGELYQFLEKNKGVAFVNEDEEWLEDMSKANSHRLLYRKANDGIHDFEVTLLSELPMLRISFTDEFQKVQIADSQLTGLYNFNNIMTAIVLGKYFKVPGQKIVAAIEGYRSTNNRSQILNKGTNTYYLDAYNANPTSMHEALKYFNSKAHANKVVVLGDMLEMGEYAYKEHLEVIHYLSQNNFEKVYLVGEEFANAMSGSERKYPVFKNTDELKEVFTKDKHQEAFILLKGSRGIGLEKLLEE